MADVLGYIPANSTFEIQFTTHSQTGAVIAPNSAFEAADIRIYKNGSATQRTSQNGWTMTSPFDSVTGLHQFQADLSDNTDAGFYATGARYTVVLVPDETVDGLAVAKVLAYFRIGPVETDLSSIPTATENADALLNRDMAAVSVTNTRSPINALRLFRNRAAIAGGTLTVYEEDDSTPAWTGAVTTAAGNPISEIDPA